MPRANLAGADLRDARVSADLSRANLERANLQDADIGETNLE